MEEQEGLYHTLPHHPPPGQTWFITLCLWNAVPHDALSHYTNLLKEIKWKINSRRKHQLYNQSLKELENDYSRTRRLYFNAYDRLLGKSKDRTIDLNQKEISEIIIEGINLWAGSHLENYAWCIMPNHVHWVFRIRERDNDGNPVYLQEMITLVKEYTTTKINKILGNDGDLWLKESFEIAVKDAKRLYRVIEYTLNNPVAAKFVEYRNEWRGSWQSNNL